MSPSVTRSPRRAATDRQVANCVGAVLSPLLANVYLHYVFDLWAQQWRRRYARGDVLIVRYADDVVLGFQDRSDAERFRRDLAQRLATFRLGLNAEKTRLIRCGRFAAQQCRERGLGRPETFQFLGFTHYCATTKDGRFLLLRKTISKRMAAKLREVRALLMRRRHWPIEAQGRWLASVARGHLAYYAVPGNIHQVVAFRDQLVRHWYGRSGAAASDTASTGSGCAATRSDGSLPPASPIPGPISDSTPAPKSGAQCVSSARWDLRGGPPARAVPTAIVAAVDAEHVLEMTAAEDEDSVETISAQSADPALGVSVRVRRADRCADHPDALSPENLVKGVAELCVAVVDEKPERLLVAELHDQVARLLGDPAAVRI